MCIRDRSYITYKIYSPEKFKAQYEAELAAKRAERKKKRTVKMCIRDRSATQTKR